MSAADEHPRPLRAGEAERAAAAVAAAFAWHEPWGAWALPDERTREATLRNMVAADINERFLTLGRASTIACTAVSLWCPPPSHPEAAAFGERRDEDAYALFGERMQALREGDALLASLRPDGDYWYLDTLATEPASMRRGLGSRLLDHDLAALDAAGEAAGLDTHTAENVAFYARRGFEVVAEARLPHGGPDVYVMLRTPRAAASPA